MKQVLIIILLLAGITAIAFASLGSRKTSKENKQAIEKKVEKQVKKKDCKRSCIFS